MVECRLQNIIDIVRHQQGNGATVHELANITHTATLALQLYRRKVIEQEMAMKVCIKLEAKLVALLRAKYG